MCGLGGGQWNVSLPDGMCLVISFISLKGFIYKIGETLIDFHLT